ncbi:Ig-like domain-containing protein [Teredinibacter haidensis]|uniref:Ig-like domain-containing protein n=1 Tax=Teredinibacter haidensis TaxID=2731755 RepID=UPI000948B489|nr:Ig-like domain-containing protein [Teredinibacter haidensis]
MVRRQTTLALAVTLLFLNGCSNNDDNQPEDGVAPADKTYVVFSPATNELPIPNDLLFGSEPLADGTMYAGKDPANPVISGIDHLDGNSVLAPIDIAFSGSLDDSQLLDASSFIGVDGNVAPNPYQNVFLLPLSYPGGDALVQASVNGTSVEVPTFSEAVVFQTAAATRNATMMAELARPTVRAELISLDGVDNNTIRITPLKPLQPETKYLVVITRILDAEGNFVYPSSAYDFIRNPESNLGNLGLDPVRGAIQGWERLAGGYFSFISSVFEAAGVPLQAPSAEEIIFTLTFTTGGTDAVLTSLAAPETFFEKSLSTQYKQGAIAKLVSGEYNVNGDNSAMTSVTDGAINSTLHALLTSPQLPDGSPNTLYSQALVGAIANGADYASIASDGSAAYIMQRAVAEAAMAVHDSGDAQQGDQQPYVDIATEAAGTVAALAQGANAAVSAIFPIPAARENSFYRVDLASNINPALQAPALIYQGQIALPIYQPLPEGDDGSNITNSSWQADANTIGALLDIAQSKEMGTTPPSNKITYRFPFPAKQANVTVPLIATLPEPSTLALFGITKPEAGWPVVISIPGITAERSSTLPVADAMAFACINSTQTGPSGAPCFASITIDRPLHGIDADGALLDGLHSVTDPDMATEANLPDAQVSESLTERHYDFTADAAANAVPMSYAGRFGSSGTLYINLKNFASTRDSLRQMALDLLNLNASLATMDIDGDGLPDFDTSRVYVYGLSLGAMDAINFIALNNNPAIQASPFSSLPKIQALVANSGGGMVTRLLSNSPRFSPRILPALATASEELMPGTSGLETYFNVFQGVVDSGDPANFISLLSQYGNTGILFSEIIGDQVIPNAADTIWGEANSPLQMITESGFSIENLSAPLTGTEPLVALAGAIKTAEATATGKPAILVSRYIEGDHTAAAAPTSSEAAFFELLQQAVTFFSYNGVVPTSIVVNPDVIEP